MSSTTIICKVDPAKMDIPDSPQKKDNAVVLTIHIRAEKVTSMCSRPVLFEDLTFVRDMFVKQLHNLNSTTW